MSSTKYQGTHEAPEFYFYTHNFKKNLNRFGPNLVLKKKKCCSGTANVSAKFQSTANFYSWAGRSLKRSCQNIMICISFLFLWCYNFIYWKYQSNKKARRNSISSQKNTKDLVECYWNTSTEIWDNILETWQVTWGTLNTDLEKRHYKVINRRIWIQKMCCRIFVQSDPFSFTQSHTHTPPT